MSTQILRGLAATISATFDQDGDVVDPGTVTVSITRADGTAVVTGATTDGTGATPRTYQLAPGATAMLDQLTATWTSSTLGTVTTEVEVVGDLLFTVAEARALGGTSASNGLLDTVAYPDAVIEAARSRITESFQDICGVAFVPRYRRVIVDRLDGSHLLLPDMRVTALRSIETRERTTWTAWTADELAEAYVTPWGGLTSELARISSGSRNVRVGYEHGWERAPQDIRRAAMILARNQIVESNFSDRATGFSSDTGTYSIGQAGTQQNAWSAFRHTGYPEVDAVLNRYMERIAGLA